MGIVLKIQVFGYVTQCRLVVVDVSKDAVSSSGSSTFRNDFTGRHGLKKKKTGIFKLNVNSYFDRESNLEPPEYAFSCYLHDHGVQS